MLIKIPKIEIVTLVARYIMFKLYEINLKAKN